MYKVFVNDRPIILTDDEYFPTSFKKKLFQQAHIYELVSRLFHSDLQGICLVCNDLESCWEKFQSYFKPQKSAGGKVINQYDETLFIYRFDKWDLPKGKLEKNESIEECAIREVEEECGINQLQIIRQLPTTYHIFEFKSAKILKYTYWFLMKTNYNGKLIPQKEEHIDKVEFKNSKQTQEALKNTYENIKILFQS